MEEHISFVALYISERCHCLFCCEHVSESMTRIFESVNKLLYDKQSRKLFNCHHSGAVVSKHSKHFVVVYYSLLAKVFHSSETDLDIVFNWILSPEYLLIARFVWQGQ